MTLKGTGNGFGGQGEQHGFSVVCAWCGRVDARETARDTAKEAAPSAPVPARPVSHTICELCFARERADIERVVRLRRKKSSA